MYLKGVLLLNKIKYFRKKKNISQHEMSLLIGISLKHYQNIENNKALPNIQTGLKLAKLLDIDPFLLFNTTDYMLFK